MSRRLLGGDPPGVQNFRDDGLNLSSRHACDSSNEAPRSSWAWWGHHYLGHKIPRHHRFW